MLRQIVMPAFLAIILLTAALGITFIFMAYNMDSENAVLESRLLNAELVARQQYLEQLVEANGQRDEAYTKTVISFDQAWLQTTIGALVGDISELDAMLLIQTRGRLLFSNYANNHESLSQRNYGHLVRVLQRNLTTRLNTAQAMRGYISFDDGVYIVAASTVWPDSEQLIERALSDNQRNILVNLERLDFSKLSEIEDKLELSSLKLTEDIDSNTVHLALGASGYLTWEPKTPGTDTLAELAIPLTLFTISILLILTLFWRRADKLVQLFQRTDQAKSIFLSAVGHELKTPLNGITSGIALMYQNELPLNQKAYLHTIERSSRELAAKVTQIIDYTRLETSELRLDPVYLDLRTLLEDVVEGAHHEKQEVGAFLALHIPTNCPTKAIGDVKRIKQIVSVLLSELLGTKDHGTISLALMVQASDPVNTTYKLVASTTSANTLFSAHTSGAASTQSQTDDGTLSWNLATVRYLAEAMGGEITVVVNPQGGKQVHVQFVLGSRAQPVVDVAQSSCAGRRALIVDNEIGDHLVLTDYLSDIGFTVQNAANEQTAISFLKNANKDRYLIFIGENVGTENGLDVARNIKKAVCNAEIDLVIMAYEPQSCDASTMQNLGVASLLARPITLGNLLELVKGLYDPATETPHEGPSLATKRKYKLLEDMSILIVEDNPVSLNLLNKIISKWCCSVTSATNGEEAVKSAMNNSFDCVVMDYHMPRMNGAVATKEIRNLGLTMPIIMLSAASDQKDIDDCLDAGANTFIPKPVATPILKKKILQALADRTDDQIAGQLSTPKP